jgi:integrase
LFDPVIAELKALHNIRHTSKPLVFASKTVFGQIDIKKAWMLAVQRAGLTDYHFHDLRHQFATLAAGQGASNVELSTAMGHRTLSMLLRYSHLDAKSTSVLKAAAIRVRFTVLTAKRAWIISPRQSRRGLCQSKK